MDQNYQERYSIAIEYLDNIYNDNEYFDLPGAVGLMAGGAGLVAGAEGLNYVGGKIKQKLPAMKQKLSKTKDKAKSFFIKKKLAY